VIFVKRGDRRSLFPVENDIMRWKLTSILLALCRRMFDNFYRLIFFCLSTGRVTVSPCKPKRLCGPRKSCEAMKPFQKDANTSQEPFWKVSSLQMILLGRYIVLVWVPKFRSLTSYLYHEIYDFWSSFDS
jgi:hypothetical protein